MPFSPVYLLLFVLALGFLLAFVLTGVMTITFEKLGLSAHSAFLLLFGSLFGSAINLPLFSVKAQPPPPEVQAAMRGLLRLPQRPFTGRTVVAANVGGCLVPLSFSIYLMLHNPLTLTQVVLGIGVVAAVSYFLSRPLPGLGIGMPIFVAPLTAAVVAVLIGGEQSPSLAYIAGTLGVLVGADVLHLPDIGKMGTPVASIGGAGTFDGIFITGIIAVLLA
jgi:uncharacterized membrane protein